jgi:hypothetical protein
MIVKNESHIIQDTLKNLLENINFDYWVICDTGSTDSTKEIIREFFSSLGIPGELYEEKWENFGYNRTHALEKAYNKTDYLFIFDADDKIRGSLKLQIPLKYDSYSFKFGSNIDASYSRTLLVNNKKKWKYIGVLHEYIESDGSDDRTSFFIDGDYYVESGRSGSRNNNPNKYLDDAIILKNAYNEEVKNKNIFLKSRYSFYCANSYFDAGKYEDAIEWYKNTLEESGWIQEKYYSCLRLYYCYENIKQKEIGLHFLVKSYKYDNERVECIYELIKYYCIENMHKISIMYYGVIQNYYETKELNNKLFLDNSVYDFYLPYYMIICCDYEKEKSLGIKMYMKIFSKKYNDISEWWIKNLLYNLKFFIDYIGKERNTFISMANEYIYMISKKYDVYTYDFMKLYIDKRLIKVK